MQRRDKITIQKVISEMNIGIERQKYPQFPWKAVEGMRDIIAHRHQTLRMEDVYITVHDEYPILTESFQNILIDAENIKR